MLIHVALFMVGLIILALGADWLVRGASSMALSLGWRPIVVGLTIVALGTSLPEFLVNIFAVVAQEDSIAVGNVVGSNIANVALILGVAAVLLPMRITRATLHREYVLMMGILLGFTAFALDGQIQRWNGLVLVTGLLMLLLFLFFRQTNRKNPLVDKALANQTTARAPSVPKQLAYIIGGIVGLGLGAHLMVEHATAIARAYAISEVVIGLTIVALGTSLPELATSVIGAFKKETALSIGNILGSNMLNVLFVIGGVAVVQPLLVEDTVVRIHLPVMVIICGLLYVLARPSLRLGRWQGAVLLLAFGGYMTYLAWPYVT